MTVRGKNKKDSLLYKNLTKYFSFVIFFVNYYQIQVYQHACLYISFSLTIILQLVAHHLKTIVKPLFNRLIIQANNGSINQSINILKTCIRLYQHSQFSTTGGTGLCSYRVRGVGGSCAEHLTVESYTIIVSLQSYLLSYLLLLVFHHPLTLSL